MSFISLLFLLFSLSYQQDSELRRSLSLEKRIIGGKNAVQEDWWFIGL